MTEAHLPDEVGRKLEAPADVIEPQGGVDQILAAAGRGLAALDRAVAGRSLRQRGQRGAAIGDPRGIGEALRGPVLGRFRKRGVGDHRVIVDVQDAVLLILAVRIGNRKDAYRR